MYIHTGTVRWRHALSPPVDRALAGWRPHTIWMGQPWPSSHLTSLPLLSHGYIEPSARRRSLDIPTATFPPAGRLPPSLLPLLQISLRIQGPSLPSCLAWNTLPGDDAITLERPELRPGKTLLTGRWLGKKYSQLSQIRFSSCRQSNAPCGEALTSSTPAHLGSRPASQVPQRDTHRKDIS
ncbi:hypothetical protein K437DRAFT_108217 [Tilletiaria anomala UBC 951]|uniref:Uncharacterized protein n=1 Tax=Tilletiaria anomala (strain ATCC 24038 / CBS 436.72 / UBC 951) TaxID=1037660 RepID=A0A066VXP9_TILAU|nr:uncharacterized protein K437DRAFT_108217 [Tilletiaria anomala UBC 951]KDN46492.1 hypothetical protein K437DRAFT_108217 [Tilletiaria anomala UBC 951]